MDLIVPVRSRCFVRFSSLLENQLLSFKFQWDISTVLRVILFLTAEKWTWGKDAERYVAIKRYFLNEKMFKNIAKLDK